MLYSIDSWPEIIAVTETMLNSNSISNIHLPNYNFFHVDSPTLAGGTAIYVKDAIKAIPRPELESSSAHRQHLPISLILNLDENHINGMVLADYKKAFWTDQGLQEKE